MRKRLLSLLLACCMAAAVLPGTALAAEPVISGICGSDLAWVLDDEGTLTVSGTGDMVDYNAASHASGPWRSYLSQIQRVVIQDGAASIGNYAFYQCTRMTSVEIPDSVTSIGSGAFFRCTGLTDVTIPGGVTDLEEYTFYGCTKLTGVTIPDSVTSIGDDVFSLCPNVTIYGAADSYAETYAGENGIPFQVIPDAAFEDVPADSWYAEAVAWAVEQGITTGTGDGTFSPFKTCSRAEIVTFLYRAAGEPVANASLAAQFTDVAAGDWYTGAVAWAVEQGITTGTGDGTTFSPMEPCSRAEIVTFLYRYEDTPGVSGIKSFTDVPADSWYAGAVAWAVEQGITTGTGDGTAFSPLEVCSRAEAVTFLYRDLA